MDVYMYLHMYTVYKYVCLVISRYLQRMQQCCGLNQNQLKSSWPAVAQCGKGSDICCLQKTEIDTCMYIPILPKCKVATCKQIL